MTSENKSHDDQPVPTRRKSRFGRAAVAAGLAAGVALLCAAAVPASAATSAASAAAVTPHAGVSGHLTGSAGNASMAAKRTVAYWTRARMLSAANGASVTERSAAAAHAAPTTASGPAGRVAATAPDQALKGPKVQITSARPTGAG